MPSNRVAPLVRSRRLVGPYVILTFEHPEVGREARAGQFVMLKAGTSAEPPLRRPFSILETDPDAGTFSVFLKAVGQGSRGLFALQPGDAAQCLGPLGRPFTAPGDGAEALMVAGGYGIAPFLMLSKELLRASKTGRVFYGGRSVADLQVRDSFEAIGVAVVAATEDGTLGHRGRVTAPLEAHLDSIGDRPASLFACGPGAMLHAVASIARRRGLPCQVSLDPWMGCGIGTCLGCVVRLQRPGEERPKYRCACTDGPVFDARVVVWEGETTSAASSGDAR